MLPSMHGRWSQDAVGGPAANTGSPFSPMSAGTPGPGHATAPILPGRPRLGTGGAQPAMTPEPQVPAAVMNKMNPSLLMRRMV